MDDYKKLIGSENLSVLQTMQTIDKNAIGILFILNEDSKLLGCVTDGDIRRFILSGGKVEESVMKAINSAPITASSITDASLLYDSRNYIAIPVVDESGKVKDILFDSRAFQKKKREICTPVVINAGGKGTRLDPFTRILPKPLIPVGDLPIIEHIMNAYQKYGCQYFSIIVNYKKDLIKAYFSDIDEKYNIDWYNEEKPLGTGGGLSYLKGKISETFFFINCDTLVLADYADIIKFHKENNNIVTMVCAYKNVTVPYGIVDIGINGKINEMKEKPSKAFLINTGMYIVEPEALDEIEDGVPVDFPTVVEKLMKKGKNVAAYPIGENDWLDMGQLDELEKMRIKLYGN